MMETACISMLVADYTQLGQVDFEGCTFLLLSVKDVSAYTCTCSTDLKTHNQILERVVSCVTMLKWSASWWMQPCTFDEVEHAQGLYLECFFFAWSGSVCQIPSHT